MSSEALSKLRKLFHSLPAPEDSPIWIVASPRIYAELHRSGVADPIRLNDPSQPELQMEGVRVDKDKALNPGGTLVQGIALMFFDEEEVAKYLNLPEYKRLIYAFKEEGENISVAFTSPKLGFPNPAPVKGKSKTLIWMKEDAETRSRQESSHEQD